MIQEIRKSNIRRLLLRYVRDHQLAAGDRLPGQNELRRLFQCGATTLTAAIQELCQEGVLLSREKVGVFVVDVRATEQFSRRIGIIMGELVGSPFQAFLNVYIEQFLSRYDCRAIWLHQREGASAKIYNGLEDIVNLRQSVETSELDGLISMVFCDAELENYLNQNGIKLIYISNYAPQPNHICLDYATMTERSVRQLAAQGFRRIEMLMSVQLDWLQRSFIEAMRKNGLPADARHFHCRSFSQIDDGEYEKWLNGVFAEWVSRTEAERPDALVVPDDMLAIRLQLFLSAHPEWQPTVIALYNDNMRLPMLPMPCGYWRFRIDRYAEFIVRNFMKMLREEKKELPFLAYLPEFVPPA